VAYPDGVLRRGEHVLAHRRPHWRMLLVPALVPPAAVFLAALLAGLADAIPSGSTRSAVRLALALLAVAAVAWLAVLPLVRWRCTHFVVTDRRVLVREGVLTRESVDVAGSTITGVRTRATAAERLVGAGTLVVATAGADEPWEFAGLGHVERLASLVEGVADQRGGLDRADAVVLRARGPEDDAEDDVDDDLEDDVRDDVEDGRRDDPGDAWGGWGDPDAVDFEESAPTRVRRGRWRRRRAARTSR
jgi:membrane protein YdbS with pleckstrin-like domain